MHDDRGCRGSAPAERPNAGNGVDCSEAAPPASSGRVIAVRPAVGATTLLRHRRLILTRDLRITKPTLVLVLNGSKIIAQNGVQRQAATGDVVLLPAGAMVDLTNAPSPGSGYEAISIIFDDASQRRDEIASKARRLQGAAVIRAPSQTLRTAAMRARSALLDVAGTPEAIARHQLAELLMWLGEAGCRFPSPAPPTTADRLRALVQDRLDEDWPGARAAAAVGMSEATLRRRLASEKETLGGLVRETRLVAAMSLLQATDEPVTQVALACGFPNHSSFSRQFRERFAVTPTHVRATEDNAVQN